MGNGLKKLDKKFLIMAGGIILLPILIIIFLAIIQGCSGGVSTHEEYEQKMISSATKYFKDKKKEPSEEGETATVKLDKLVSEGYIKSTEKLLGDTSCKGEVKVRRNGASVEINDGGFLNYTVDLVCDKYETTHLIDKITEEIVTSESGLYQVGEELIFKGDKVKNYISIYDFTYRIVSVDKDGILKLVRTEPEIASRLWDNKYNVEVNYSYGINLYKDSSILTYLMKDYENAKKVNKKTKQIIVAYDVCIGRRSSADYSISKEVDCSEKLEKQVISMLNASDFAMASADPNCNSVIAKSCKNYNYLSKIATSTWTMNASSENTYEVFFISNGLLEHQNANVYNEYNTVIYIDGDELYTTGEGTATKPYIITEES